MRILMSTLVSLFVAFGLTGYAAAGSEGEEKA